MRFGFLVATIFLFSALMAGFLIWNDNFLSRDAAEIKQPSNVLRIRDAIINVDILDTAPDRALGLSGRDSISDDEGALFVFDLPRPYSFWMKDMRFPIDIVWIGEGRSVVDITENLKPESYPAHYQPRYPAQYVLEVNAGWARRHGVEVGMKVTLPGL